MKLAVTADIMLLGLAKNVARTAQRRQRAIFARYTGVSLTPVEMEGQTVMVPSHVEMPSATSNIQGSVLLRSVSMVLCVAPMTLSNVISPSWVV